MDAALSLLKEVGVDAILGPQKSAQANFVMDMGDRAHVPIISFSATSPSLLSKTPYFVQTALGDNTQVGALAAIVQAFQWREVVLIYEDTDYGKGIMPYLSNKFHGIDIRVSYRSIVPLLASDDFLLKELYKMMTMQTRVFVVHMSHSLGARLFLKAKEIGMMNEGYAWIITSGLMDLLYSMDSHVVEAMQGVLGIKPLVSKSKRLESFAVRWKRKFLRRNPSVKQAETSVYGLRAYDSLWALAMAAERVGLREPNLNSNSQNNSTNPFSFRISETGPKLLKQISEISFKGIGGEFKLVNGSLKASAFQILNVVGKGEREVGIWTQSVGITREFSMNATAPSLTARDRLRGIIWPGESTVPPKGWEFPTGGKKLMIGVPMKHTDFVKVDIDPVTNAPKFSGYCIEVFNSVMQALQYAVPYEYVAFAKPDGTSAGSNDDLVHQVFLQNYGGAVGDLTITAQRASYADYTLPFAEGGVSMIVSTKYEDENNMWTFLKPLHRDLWLTSIAFFILTGFAVWVLEHRTNPAFRGPPSQNVGMIFFFPFSTLVFAHRERITSNFTRLVLAVWVFVVLILSSTYTASLSSRLTVQRLRPAITDVKELINKGHYVGCQEGSFIVGLLKRLGIEESKIKTYKFPDDCDEALSSGSTKGGISAFFDVVPYTKSFLSKYPNYIIVGPIHRTDGFGFVFPKGSPLVADVSLAIINLTENGKIPEIGGFRSKTLTCTDMDSSSNSTSVRLESFEGLFAITGAITTSCLLLYFAAYLHKNRDFLQGISSSGTTRWSKLRAACRHFDQKDLSSYPFTRNGGFQNQFQGGVDHMASPSHFNDSPVSPRNANSSGMLSPSPREVEMTESNESPIHPVAESNSAMDDLV